ncbi:universal stress protein [Natronobeatus ordinarius]|uniref:universal stress protein n=1 Tax=Natronobeatus ordinarius TaxID=2963433 RepID=UPI0020CC576D|nr:universal stress protein [Natronobeatus ordinarius]
MVVVAAVDRSEDAQDVIAEGTQLASALEVPLHVVHAVGSAEFAQLQREHVSSTDAEGGVLSRRDVAAERARELVNAEDDAIEIAGLDGEPAESIVEYANERDAAYVVLGGRDRTPAGKAVFGSVAQSVILSLDRPVVVV